MKKRHLRTGIEKAMTVLTTLLFLMLIMVDDISIKAIPVYLLLAAITAVNILILKKYGKGVWNE